MGQEPFPAEEGADRPPPLLAPRRPRLPAFVWGIVLLAAFFGVQMVMGTLVTLLWVLAGGDPSELLRDLFRPSGGDDLSPLPALGERWAVALVLVAAGASALVALPLSVIAHRDRFGGLQRLWGRPSLRALGYGILGWVLILGGSIALEVAAGETGRQFFERSSQARLTGVLARPEFLVFSIPVAGLLAPAAEELIFRGFFFRALQDWLKRRRWEPRSAFGAAALLSALVWAVVHGDPIVLPLIATFGVVLAWVYERTGTIAAPLVTHALHNTLSLLILAALAPAG